MVWKHTVQAKSFVLMYHLLKCSVTTVLRSATQGRGTFMMVFDHYEDVPKSVQEEIIKKAKGEANLPQLQKTLPTLGRVFFEVQRWVQSKKRFSLSIKTL